MANKPNIIFTLADNVGWGDLNCYGGQVPTPPEQIAASGETANFTVTITNTGDVGLGNIEVTDALVPDCNFTVPSLAPGSGSSKTCSKTNVTSSFTNEAVVHANVQGYFGTLVSNSTEAVVLVGSIPTAAIELTKTPANWTIESGQTANFTVSVTNLGEIALANVVVTDPLVPDCNFNVASLAVGASENKSCSRSNIASSFTNVAMVEAHAEGYPDYTVSDSAEAVVTVEVRFRIYQPLVFQ